MKTPEQLKGAIREMAVKNNLRAQEVLQMFLFERLIERLSKSSYKDNFILKGGLLISSMIGITERTTMDMDTTIRGIQMEEEKIVEAVKEIISIDVDDSIVFDYIKVEPIREDDDYNNYRIHIQAKYGKIDAPMKIDITTGDIITPAAIQYNYPLIFDNRYVSVMAYSIETVLAEKYETIIRRGIGTTRARDYYDLHTLFLSRKNEIHPQILREAVLRTSEKRESTTLLKNWREIVLELEQDQHMLRLWENYVQSNKYIGSLDYLSVLKSVEQVAILIDIN